MGICSVALPKYANKWWLQKIGKAHLGHHAARLLKTCIMHERCTEVWCLEFWYWSSISWLIPLNLPGPWGRSGNVWKAQWRCSVLYSKCIPQWLWHTETDTNWALFPFLVSIMACYLCFSGLPSGCYTGWLFMAIHSWYYYAYSRIISQNSTVSKPLYDKVPVLVYTSCVSFSMRFLSWTDLA